MNVNRLTELATARATVARLEAELAADLAAELKAAREAQPARDYWADHVKAVGEGRVHADDGYPVRVWPEY